MNRNNLNRNAIRYKAFSKNYIMDRHLYKEAMQYMRFYRVNPESDCFN